MFFFFIQVCVFKNGPSKIYGRQPLKNFKGCFPHKFYLVHYWIHCLIYFFQSDTLYIYNTLTGKTIWCKASVCAHRSIVIIEWIWHLVATFYISSFFNPFQPSVAFHIETSHLICTANQMTGFYVKCNFGNGLTLVPPWQNL